MAFHQRIQSLLLAGVRFPPAAPLPVVAAPAVIAAMVDAVAPKHAASNALAIEAGNRYRSAFWALYLLSALAVMCAVMPLALGWDDDHSDMHAWAPFWAVLEVVLISVLGVLYRRGQQQDWQGEWLTRRSEAELAWYLPLVAPLVVPAGVGAQQNWYRRMAGNTLHLPENGVINALCAQLEPRAAGALESAWSDPAFVGQYVPWAMAQLESQRAYHDGVALRSAALMHRIHKINAWLFMLTFAGALAHLVIHSMWLSFITIFFPALGASLHGALAQTESYRLTVTSRRLSDDLAKIIGAIGVHQARGETMQMRGSIELALTLILAEHRDWHMLVRPHHLPLG